MSHTQLIDQATILALKAKFQAEKPLSSLGKERANTDHMPAMIMLERGKMLSSSWTLTL